MVQETFTAMRFGRKPFLIFFSQVKIRHAWSHCLMVADDKITISDRRVGGGGRTPPCPVVAKTTIGCLNCSKRE